ncbi:MAG: hypothetical protein LBL75_01925 [Rickettsiales bacterium]|jgi:hypothetical protein|nr:hypothetical protein [Rickettsiales bacterium]
MRKKFNILLIDLLWIVAIALFASFWFNIRFNFNIWSGAHWEYLSAAQLSPTGVVSSFYISGIVFVALFLFGIFIINHPRNSGIRANKADSPATELHAPLPNNLQPLGIDPNYSPLPSAPVLPRPPRILNSINAPIPPRNPSTPIAAPIPTTPDNTEVINSELENLFSSLNYMVVRPLPRISGQQYNMFALGNNEVMYLGLYDLHTGNITAGDSLDAQWTDEMGYKFNSPVKIMANALHKIRDMISKTLDDEIKIQINGFIVMNNTSITNIGIANQLGRDANISVYNSVDELRNNIAMNTAPTTPDASETFVSYTEYMTTLVQTLT